MEVDTLAQIIREVDGNHDLGAGALAELILNHPDFKIEESSSKEALKTNDNYIDSDKSLDYKWESLNGRRIFLVEFPDFFRSSWTHECELFLMIENGLDWIVEAREGVEIARYNAAHSTKITWQR